jgi:hypothetical protein
MNEGPALLVLVLVTLSALPLPSSSAPSPKSAEDENERIAEKQLAEDLKAAKEKTTKGEWQEDQTKRYDAHPQWFIQPGRPCDVQFTVDADELFIEPDTVSLLSKF